VGYRRFLPGFTAYVDDDRGQRMPLWSYRASIRSDDPVQRSLAIRAVHIEALEHRRLGIFMGLAFAVAIIGSSAFGLLTWLIWLVFPAALVMSLLMRRAVRTRITPTVRLTLLSEACCPSCAYDLKGLATEPDGRTVCPECRGAWVIDEDMLRSREARERLTIAPIPNADTADDRAARDTARRIGTWLGWRRTYVARDAKGRMLELINPGFLAKRPPCWEEVPAEDRGRLRRRLYFVGWPLRLLIALTSIPMFLWIGWTFLLRTGPGGAVRMPIMTAVGIFQGVILPLIMLGVVLNPLTRRGTPIIRIMLSAGHCPCCAARLPPPTTAEGEMTCTACRAAWKPASPTPRPG
jgi:hypothetical protein